MKKSIEKPRNFVAKYDYLVNKAKTFTDKKKEFKKGKTKYKCTQFECIFYKKYLTFI